jgi:hypothetical protein
MAIGESARNRAMRTNRTMLPGLTNLADDIPARRVLNSILFFQQHHRQDRNRDRQYHIQPQRTGECRRKRFVKCLTDLFHLARDQAAVDLPDSFGRTRLLQELLLGR